MRTFLNLICRFELQVCVVKVCRINDVFANPNFQVSGINKAPSIEINDYLVASGKQGYLSWLDNIDLTIIIVGELQSVLGDVI